jgi:hypothetical protein
MARAAPPPLLARVSRLRRDDMPVIIETKMAGIAPGHLLW